MLYPSHRRALNVFQLFLISIQRFAITYLNRYVGNNLTRLPSIFSVFRFPYKKALLFYLINDLYMLELVHQYDLHHLK